MKIRYWLGFLLLLTPLILFQGCRKEYDYVRNPENEAFDFIVTEAQRQYINESRGEQYEVTDPVPLMQFGGNEYQLNKFEIRGENTLNFFRKGFSVNTGHKIMIYNTEENKELYFKEFKLLAMVYDYTYIENCTGAGLFKVAGLWPMYDFFTEVRLNGHTQGLYHFIEDPVDYFIKKENASFVVRRGYNHVVKSCSASREHIQDIEYYKGQFKTIYSLLPDFSGKQLYDSLSAYIDLEQYFKKLSIDLLIKNGDYTDEIFLYTKIRNGKEIFGVCPWDLDDIFADQPHEIGRDWACGTIFGKRVYSSMNDIITDVGSKLLFSIEDDLDYIIAKDNFLYQEYLKSLRTVIEKADPAAIDSICDYTYEHIGRFYSMDSIISQSKYDQDETTYDLFVSNLAEKREMLKERSNWILQELDKQQTGMQ